MDSSLQISRNYSKQLSDLKYLISFPPLHDNSSFFIQIDALIGRRGLDSSFLCNILSYEVFRVD